MWAAAMDVVEWLKGIGLGQYEATFREHAIDSGVLPDLTEPDLEKFGVPFGHRKRLIKAIAKLATGASEPSEAAQAPPPSPRQPTSRADAERRPIAVMFCDLVGRRVSPCGSTLRIGAIWSAPISTPRPRR